MSQQPNSDLQAELDALRQKLGNLEAKHRDSLRRTSRSWRPGFSRIFLLGALPLAALLAAGGLLYGQGAGDALFIDTNGNTTLSGKLEVLDSTTLSNATITETLTVTKDATLEGTSTTVKGNLTTGPLSVSSKTKGVRVNSWLDLTSSVCGIGSIGTNLYLNQPDNKWKWANTHSNLGGTAIQFDDCTKASASKIMFLRASGPSTADADAPVSESMRIDHNGNVGIGTTSPLKSKLEVMGDARINGKVTQLGRWQVDDKPENTYQISPRYHLTLTGPIYGGKTKTIPHDTLKALCADNDGCQVRLAMTRWSADTQTESASVFFTFYYSQTGDGHWRASKTDAGDASGIDGNGTTKHVRNIWDTCYLTDGTYANYKNLGDKQQGMQLLVYNGTKNANRTCELTLID